ncbi:MAG: helix-turn-helix transcriptional regulator, partial [Novosphingobium sp.]|nr:helix-turn-helix transcriptional regulator [Novosphingobium sp.]
NGQTVIALCAALAALDAFELPSQPQSDADGLTLLSAKAIPELIGQRLREARERKGLTQLQLAQAMGLTTSRTVQDLERPRKKGQSIIGLQSAISALGVDGL